MPKSRPVPAHHAGTRTGHPLESRPAPDGNLAGDGYGVGCLLGLTATHHIFIDVVWRGYIQSLPYKDFGIPRAGDGDRPRHSKWPLGIPQINLAGSNDARKDDFLSHEGLQDVLADRLVDRRGFGSWPLGLGFCFRLGFWFWFWFCFYFCFRLRFWLCLGFWFRSRLCFRPSFGLLGFCHEFSSFANFSSARNAPIEDRLVRGPLPSGICQRVTSTSSTADSMGC